MGWNKSILTTSSKQCCLCNDEGSMSIWKLNGVGGGNEYFVCPPCYKDIEKQNEEMKKKIQREKEEKKKKEEYDNSEKEKKSRGGERPKSRWEW